MSLQGLHFQRDANATCKGTPAKAVAGAPPESPTTARPLDFDDEPSEAVASATTPTAPISTLTEDQAPPKPPRPVNAREQAENTLREAFPSIDAAVVKAVLTASRGQVEPAFNALLGECLRNDFHQSTGLLV